MTKTEIAKAVVNNLTGFSVGAAATSFLSTNRKHSDNAAVEFLIDGATVITGLAVGGMVHEHVRAYTDVQIDKIADQLNELRSNIKKNSNKK